MNRIKSSVLAAFSLTVLCIMPLGAQTNSTIFDFPGSTLDSYTTINGINDEGVMVGTENTTGGPRDLSYGPTGL